MDGTNSGVSIEKDKAGIETDEGFVENGNEKGYAIDGSFARRRDEHT